jgi:hypothetical protein
MCVTGWTLSTIIGENSNDRRQQGGCTRDPLQTWGPVYLALAGFCKLREALECDLHVKVEELAPQMWTPVSEISRRYLPR